MTSLVVSGSQLMGELLRSEFGRAGFSHVETADAVRDDCGAELVLLHIDDNPVGLSGQVDTALGGHPQCRIVILGPEHLLPHVANELGARIAACVPDSISIDELITVLKAVEAGFRIVPFGAEDAEQWPGPGAGPAIRAHRVWPSKEHGAERTPLSHREMEILEFLKQGHCNKAIANALGIEESTVKVHLRSCYSKLRINNRTQAAIWALENLPGDAAQRA